MSQNFIRTATGKTIDFLELDPSQLDLEDIAHNLSMICRFVGGVRSFYSVAEHSLNVSALCEAKGEDPLWGLFHDAPEAYIGDVSSPLKALLPEYKRIEHSLMKAIALKFALDKGDFVPQPGTIPLGVKKCDVICVNIEGSELTPNSWMPRDEFGPDADVVQIRNLTPAKAEAAFLGRYKDLLYVASQRKGLFVTEDACAPRPEA
jgi:hypothetical protein